MALELTFSFDRQTKNTVRYHEDVNGDGPAIVGTIYLQKAAAAELGDPVNLSVVITEGE